MTDIANATDRQLLVALIADVAELRVAISSLARAIHVMVVALQSPMGGDAVRETMKYTADAAPHVFKQ